jgi:two-component system sensor histidine kinase BaeS
MRRRSRSLRARLLVALVLVAAGVLLVAGTATYALVRRSIEDTALDDLRDRSDALAAGLAELRITPDDPTTVRNELRASLTRLRGAMSLTDVRVVVVADDGRLAAPRPPRLAELLALPDGLTPDDVDPARLLAGDEVSGRDGDLVFLARPVGRSALGTSVVVATDEIDTSVLSRAQPLLLAAVLGVLAGAALVSVWLARRLTRPIASVRDAARVLARGDLAARATVPPGTDEELVALADTLNAMAAELERAHGAEHAFLLSVSHDLRTPLTSIRGYAEALADGTLDDGDDEARRRAATVIGAEARRLERLVGDLLDLSRLDAREFTLHPRPCDAAAVVQDAADGFAPAARDLGIALHVERGAPVAADVDPDRLGQVVANLVENALKYAVARVDVAARADGAGRLAVVVADDGPGIPAEDLPRVFDRLYTVRAAPGRAVGTGLGLAIVRQLAAAMGGTAIAERGDGGGTRFVVTVPLGAPRDVPDAHRLPR